MTCFTPLSAYRSTKKNPTGKYSLIFPKKNEVLRFGEAVQVACGQCIGCRLDYSREWMFRCVQEAKEHEYNSFITLTYNDKNLPTDNSLNKRHWQKFMKRLRKRVEKVARFKGCEHKRIRYYHAGEYGERFSRPHYHALLFGLDFGDKVRCGTSPLGDPLFTSAALEDIWGKGFVSTGPVNWNTAAYVARYVLKKVTGDVAEAHYQTIDWATGEFKQKQQEYVTMSRGGSVEGPAAIGYKYYEKNKDRIYPLDYVNYHNKEAYYEMRVPKFYDGLLELDRPDLYEKIKKARKEKAIASKDNTEDRLRQRREVKERQAGMLKRKL